MNNCENCKLEQAFSMKLGVIFLAFFTASAMLFLWAAVATKDLEQRAVKAENKVKNLQREIRNIPWSQW
jgi:hypothetical protein